MPTELNGAPQIVIDRLSHTYKPPRGRSVLAVDDVSLEVGRREFLALLGPSGCGKSTLLYLLGGFLPMEKGTIRIDGKPVIGPGPTAAWVFQHFALFPWKTRRGNVVYAGWSGPACQSAEREQERRAQAFIDMVGLRGFEDSYPSQLSGGTKQRTGDRAHASDRSNT